MRDEKRLQALEARLAAQERPASTLMDALHRACTAAVRDKIARRLDGVEDTAEQAALRNAWRALPSVGVAAGARTRIAARLEQMAARRRAHPLSRPRGRLGWGRDRSRRGSHGEEPAMGGLSGACAQCTTTILVPLPDAWQTGDG